MSFVTRFHPCFHLHPAREVSFLYNEVMLISFKIIHVLDELNSWNAEIIQATFLKELRGLEVGIPPPWVINHPFLR